MAKKIQMLALSPTMQTGVIAKWNKKEGDAVKSGDVLCEVETDKATMDYETNAEGKILKILVAQGGKAEVGDSIAVIGTDGEDISALLKEVESDKTSKKPAPSTPKPAGAPATGAKTPAPKPETISGSDAAVKTAPVVSAESSKGKIFISPLASRLAHQKGIPLGAIRGTGPGGRIIKRDVEEAKVRGFVTAGVSLKEERIPVSMKRQVIAKRLTESKNTAPHYYLKTSARVDELIRARESLNKKSNLKISVNAFLIKLASEALIRHPLLNASWEGDSILKHGRVDIALAVAQQDGLITPVVRNTESKGIIAIDEELKVLIEKAKTNTIAMEEFTNSTFTISSLGSYGVEEFSAIINPPNAAILAVGMMKKEPVVDDSGHVNVETRMSLTLSCDHRIVDGAVGAMFLADLKQIIEYPIQGMI